MSGGRGLREGPLQPSARSIEIGERRSHAAGPGWIVLSTETSGASFPADTKAYASHHGAAFEAIGEEGWFRFVEVVETEGDRGEQGSLKQTLIQLRCGLEAAQDEAACLRADGAEPCAASVEARELAESRGRVIERLVDQLKVQRGATCEHTHTLDPWPELPVESRATWCRVCGALHVGGEWRLPGEADR